MFAYVLLAAIQAATVPATVPAATAPAVSTSANNPNDKLICKEEEETGTRLGSHKVCMTKAHWRDAYVQQRDAVKHAQDNLGYRHQ